MKKCILTLALLLSACGGSSNVVTCHGATVNETDSHAQDIDGPSGTDKLCVWPDGATVWIRRYCVGGGCALPEVTSD